MNSSKNKPIEILKPLFMIMTIMIVSLFVFIGVAFATFPIHISVENNAITDTTTALLLTATARATPTPSPTPTPHLLDPNFWHDDSLITNDPCAAPCWNGITPGDTTWHDSIEIIENLSGVQDLEIIEYEGQIAAVWHSDGSEEYCCAVVSITDDSIDDTDVVNFIQLRLAPDITLGELIEAQGEPTYLINGEVVTDDQAYIVLIYPDISILVYAFVAGAENGALSASSEIWFVFYLTSDVVQNEIIGNNQLQEWEGYQSFSYYAESEENPYEVTPEPTSESE